MNITEFPIIDVGQKQKIIVVVGPTASGKSDLAVHLAEKFSGEVVNADSMQVYREMNIGTAKSPPGLMQRIPHHLFDIVDPDEEFTVADYCNLGRSVLKEISLRGNTAVIVGGTGLYIRALLHGLADVPGADDAARAEYNSLADRLGNEQLLESLREVDPVSAARIHPNNRVRIIRALEVFRQSGQTISALQSEHRFTAGWCNPLTIGINVERDELYRRINARVDLMIAAGLVAEVESLLARGYSPELKSLAAIGYREICEYLAGKYGLSEAIEIIKQKSRHYAKRQLTWFNKDPEVKWFKSPLVLEDVSAMVTWFLGSENDG